MSEKSGIVFVGSKTPMDYVLAVISARENRSRMVPALEITLAKE
jgi:DNA-binding protein